MHFDTKKNIYLYRPFVDGRRSFNGLFALVKYEMNLGPFDECYFVFTSKKRDKLRIIYWDKTGFALWSKKLEKEKFPWPTKESRDSIVLDHKHLQWILKGLDYWKIRLHEELKF